MRRLILHIGAHKTGTTALQQGLHLHRELLAQRGANYVSSDDAAHLHSFLGYASPDRLIPDGMRVKDLDALAQRFAEAKGDIVIGSSENFSFFFQRDSIEALARALRPLFAEVRILCYIRRQDRHAISHHQEGAKPHRAAEAELWGHALGALPEPSPNHALYLNYDRRLGFWADAFGDAAMDIRIYDRALLAQGDIFVDFLQRIGLDSTGMQPMGERNVSLGAAQSKAGHLMARAGLRGKVVEAILSKITPNGRLLPSQAQAQAFLEPYREGNRRLNQRFGLSAEDWLFSDASPDLPDVPQEAWTEDGATTAFLAAISQVGEGRVAKAEVPDLSVDDLRNAALALQQRNPEAALRLVDAALVLRPTGPTLLRLKADLELRLSGG